MFNDVLQLYKPVGKTPFEIVQEVKRNNPSLVNQKISYAGRLDPMAEGLLLLLVGNENKNRKLYENYAKTYTFQCLLGVATDSYDLLGKITKTVNVHEISIEAIEAVFKTLRGKQEQLYPPYSAKPVLGKPMYYWARNNLLHTITIPKKEITIHSAELHSVKTISSQKLLLYLEEIIPKIHGTFRQEEILLAWRRYLAKSNQSFPMLNGVISCSSGTYIRGIVHVLGEKLAVPATTYSITRTAIGPYTIDR